MSEAKVKEVSVHYQFGGSLQLIQYKLTGTYEFGAGRVYEVPADWDEAQVAEFEENAAVELHDYVEAVAQLEFDKLEEQREELNG